jgi:hypothetical protein
MGKHALERFRIIRAGQYWLTGSGDYHDEFTT